MECIENQLPMILDTTPQVAKSIGPLPWMAAGARYARNFSTFETVTNLSMPLINGLPTWSDAEPFVQHNCLQIPPPDPEDIHSSAHLISTLTFDTLEDLLWVGSCSVGITTTESQR